MLKYYLNISISILGFIVCLYLGNWQWQKYIRYTSEPELYFMQGSFSDIKFELINQSLDRERGSRFFSTFITEDDNFLIEIGFATQDFSLNKSVISENLAFVPMLCPKRPFIDNIFLSNNLDVNTKNYKVLSIDISIISYFLGYNLSPVCYRLLNPSEIGLKDYHYDRGIRSVKHLNYALQWLVFAVFALGYGVWICWQKFF